MNEQALPQATWTNKAAAMWLVFALAMTITVRLSVLDCAFVFTHSENDATLALGARSLANHGFLKRAFVPVINNDPLGIDPQGYIHWPPLFFMEVAVWYRAFGESEAVGRTFMLVTLIFCAAATGFIAAKCAGACAGVFAAFAMLVTPIIFQFDFLLSKLLPALFPMLLAVYAYLCALEKTAVNYKWAIIGLVSIIVAVLTSWETSLVCVGLLVAAVWSRDSRQLRLAIAYCTAAATTGLSVLALYAITYPTLILRMWRVILFRLGLVPDYAGTPHGQPSATQVLQRYWSYLDLLGTISVISLGCVIAAAWIFRKAEGNHHSRIALTALMAPPLLWFLLMRNHCYLHRFQLFIAVPCIAVAVAVTVQWLAELGTRRQVSKTASQLLMIGLFVVTPAVMSKPLIDHTIGRLQNYAGSDKKRTPPASALNVGDVAPPGSVVITNKHSSVFTYYCQRHTLFCSSPKRLDELLERVKKNFPTVHDVYLVIFRQEAGEFADAKLPGEKVKETNELIIRRIRVKPA